MEFRDPSWWKVIDKIKELGIAFCSVDAPGLPRTRIVANDVVYLRMHGYKKWYSYETNEKEEEEVNSNITNIGVKENKKVIGYKVKASSGWYASLLMYNSY